MILRSSTSKRRGLCFRLIAFALIVTTSPGCLVTGIIEETAGGESKEAVHFILSASDSAYDITRWWSTGQETLTIPRHDLPESCESARFFLDDSAHELQIAQPIIAYWVARERPLLPDDNYPHCALLVSYGSFSELSAFEGVAVTSATGVIATNELKKPQPAAWILAPVAIGADVFIFLVALVTIPVWAPIGLILENSEAKREQKAKEKEKEVLPPPVTACWTAIESVMEKHGPSNPDQPFNGFDWIPSKENAFVVTTTNEVFSENNPVPIDTRATLRQGRAKFQIEYRGSLWTAADIECGLQAGNVVAIRVNTHK